MIADMYLPPSVGSRIRSELNDLKRTPQACAAEIGWHVDDVENVLCGRSTEGKVRALISAIIETYPISPNSFIANWDDTEDGVLILSRDESLDSRRVFDRVNASGGRSAYYEYRDTAISRLNGLRPEWIRPLRFTPDPNPRNEDVAMNNGHLLHQVTFFAGDVNFYFEDEGNICSAEMSWGDSNYIPPFIAHSFTTRDPEAKAFIVAITFAGPVKKAAIAHSSEDSDVWRRTLQKELAPRQIHENVLLHHQLIDLVDTLGDPASAASSTLSYAETSASGTNEASTKSAYGQKSSVQVQTSDQNLVILRPETNREGLEVEKLATPPGYLETTFLHLRFCDVGYSKDSLPLAQFTTYRGVYVYCCGPAVELTWKSAGKLRSRNLARGDSAFIRSFVPFSFAGSPDSEVIVAAVPGDISQITLHDLLHHHDIDRAMRETQTWFN